MQDAKSYKRLVLQLFYSATVVEMTPVAQTNIEFYDYEAACNRDARFHTIFKKAPKPTFRKGTNVKQLLVKAKLLK